MCAAARRHADPLRPCNLVQRTRPAAVRRQHVRPRGGRRRGALVGGAERFRHRLCESAHRARQCFTTWVRQRVGVDAAANRRIECGRALIRPGGAPNWGATVGKTGGPARASRGGFGWRPSRCRADYRGGGLRGQRVRRRVRPYRKRLRAWPAGRVDADDPRQMAGLAGATPRLASWAPMRLSPKTAKQTGCSSQDGIGGRAPGTPCSTAIRICIRHRRSGGRLYRHTCGRRRGYGPRHRQRCDTIITGLLSHWFMLY